MRSPPIPVVFEPILKPRPWGGRRLEALLGKRLRANELVGESWELSPLPGDESRVRGGPFAGLTLTELLSCWGSAPAPGASALPWLVKFLDARENLSVQVHPSVQGGGTGPSGTTTADNEEKHEAWYVLAADAGSMIYAGLRPGVTPAELARAANTSALIELLHAWPAVPREFYYLPSGTVHALGAGVVVAEIQSPVDVTYRLYDWGRLDQNGRPRPLHVVEALANVRYDVDARILRPETRAVPHPFGSATRLARCPAFTIDLVRLCAGANGVLPSDVRRVCVVVEGRGSLVCSGGQLDVAAGDVALLPAGGNEVCFSSPAGCTWLEVT